MRPRVPGGIRWPGSGWVIRAQSLRQRWAGIARGSSASRITGSSGEALRPHAGARARGGQRATLRLFRPDGQPQGHCRSAPCTPCPPQTWLPWGLTEPEPHGAQSSAALLSGSRAQRPVSLGCAGPSASGVVVVVQTFTLPTSQTRAAADTGEWQATCQLPEQCQPPASRDPTPQPPSPSQALIPALSRPLEGDRYQSHCTDADTEEFSGYNRE